MTKVRELLDIPDHVRKMDFTVALTEGVAHPEQTVASYVITPRIADAFDQALGMIDGALRDGQSGGTYLHGSFGSGKSHFMAVLSLLLSNEEVAWGRKELHDLRTKYPWTPTAKVLELQMHLLGKDSLEEAIYPAYLEYLDRHHPDAPTPGVFADEELFDNAASLLQRMGDEAFFGPMNEGLDAAEDDDGWGELATEGVWTRDSFDEARGCTDPKRRAELLHALLQTHFQAFRRSARAYKELDEGLWALSHHAKALGYDVIVLFLDELILRMSMGASQPQWLNDMVMSMIKLVEGTHSGRAVPIVSYIARQRALQEMVGDQLAGPDSHRLQHALSLARGRFGQLELPNDELPAIVEKRVLRPINDEARAQIDAAFAQLQRSASGAWTTLTAGTYDAQSFRRLYPFSPSLVETLVALSSSLQRQRTSIKLLTEMLVEHIDDLELGTLVGVGDLFDLLASGDESAQGIMRERFRAAIGLYKHDLLPMIQASHGTTTAERCQRLRDDHPLRLGCANCAERACRTDNRIAKTLLVAALAPNAPGLKDLTVGRLVELNHGHIRAPFAGQEKQAVATKLRKWASDLHQIQLGRQDDPGVSIELHGVDLKPIMDQASAVNSSARRQAEVRRMLFEAMGVAADVEAGVDETIEWRGSRRLGHVRFGNVRTMPAQVLQCPDDHDWRLVVDFPFDDDGHGPDEDAAVLEGYRDAHGGSWTLVWLPSFFSDGVNALLGELMILDHILDENDATRQDYVKHLSPEQQNMAINSMRSLQSQKRTQVFEAMRKAYGVASAGRDDEHLDPSRRMDQHLHTMQPGLRVSPGLAPDLSHALQRYIPALLEERYPRHPRFPRVPTRKRIGDVLGWFDDLMDREDHKIALDKASLEQMRGYLGELGFVRVSESAALLREDGTIQAIEKKRLQRSVEHPTAAQVAAWFDEDGKLGLSPEAMAMVVRAYARAKARTLVAGHEPFEFVPGKPIPGTVVLQKPDLPSPSEWAAGLEMAGYLGITLPSRALHGDNLERLRKELGARLTEVGAAASTLPGHLRAWHEVLGLPADTPRLTTADSAAALVAELTGKPGVEQVRILGGFTPQTSPGALGRSLGSCVNTARVLANKLTLGVFRQLRGLADDAEAAHVIDEATRSLRQDEINVVLAARIQPLAEQGQALLEHSAASAAPAPTRAPAAVTKPGTETVLDAPLAASGGPDVVAALEHVLGQARDLAASGDALVLAGHITITVTVPRPERS